MFYVYVLRSQMDSGFYIGYTNDLRARLRQHKAGKCCATAHRNPWKLIYYEAYLNQADAMGRERYLKSGAGSGFLKAQLRNYLAKYESINRVAQRHSTPLALRVHPRAESAGVGSSPREITKGHAKALLCVCLALVKGPSVLCWVDEGFASASATA